MRNKLLSEWRPSVSATLLLCGLLLSGCLHPRLDRGKELIEHPQFGEAVRVAPQFVEKALEIIVELEAEIERK